MRGNDRDDARHEQRTRARGGRWKRGPQTDTSSPLLRLGVGRVLGRGEWPLQLYALRLYALVERHLRSRHVACIALHVACVLLSRAHAAVLGFV